jgi:hypothetical protein
MAAKAFLKLSSRHSLPINKPIGGQLVPGKIQQAPGA